MPTSFKVYHSIGSTDTRLSPPGQLLLPAAALPGPPRGPRLGMLPWPLAARPGTCWQGPVPAGAAAGRSRRCRRCRRWFRALRSGPAARCAPRRWLTDRYRTRGVSPAGGSGLSLLTRATPWGRLTSKWLPGTILWRLLDRDTCEVGARAAPRFARRASGLLF